MNRRGENVHYYEQEEIRREESVAGLQRGESAGRPVRADEENRRCQRPDGDKGNCSRDQSLSGDSREAGEAARENSREAARETARSGRVVTPFVYNDGGRA